MSLQSTMCIGICHLFSKPDTVCPIEKLIKSDNRKLYSIQFNKYKYKIHFNPAINIWQIWIENLRDD